MSQRIRKRYYSTLVTSVINRQRRHASLKEILSFLACKIKWERLGRWLIHQLLSYLCLNFTKSVKIICKNLAKNYLKLLSLTRNKNIIMFNYIHPVRRKVSYKFHFINDIDTPNYNKQNYPFCRLRLYLETECLATQLLFLKIFWIYCSSR